jgi:hypothetical protein
LRGIDVAVNMMFQAHPGEEENAEGEVEQSFVRDGEDDEAGREREEDDEEPVEVVIAGFKAVREREDDG